MDFLRRNTDYALRAMVHMAGQYGREPVSTRDVARAEDISYQLACKLMQRLHKSKLVKSSMGPKGGFRLSREPAKINLLQTIKAIQGPLSVNRCFLHYCNRQSNCPIRKKLAVLQENIESYLSDITLDELLDHSKKQKPRILKGKKNGRR